MKYEEMKEKVDRIKKLADELYVVDNLCGFTRFDYNISFLYKGVKREEKTSVYDRVINIIVPPELIQALALKRKRELEAEIEELQK